MRSMPCWRLMPTETISSPGSRLRAPEGKLRRARQRDARPPWRRPSTCCGRSARDRSSTLTQPSHGSRRVEDTPPAWGAAIGHQERALGLEHLEDHFLLHVRVSLRLGMGHAFVGQPRIEVLEARERRARREEPAAHHAEGMSATWADLVFDLPLLPAGRRRTGPKSLSASPQVFVGFADGRLDQVVAHELLEAPVEGPLLAHEHGLDRCLHVAMPEACLRHGMPEACLRHGMPEACLRHGMPRRGAPSKNANAFSCASNTISWLSRG